MFTLLLSYHQVKYVLTPFGSGGGNTGRTCFQQRSVERGFYHGGELCFPLGMCEFGQEIRPEILCSGYMRDTKSRERFDLVTYLVVISQQMIVLHLERSVHMAYHQLGVHSTF